MQAQDRVILDPRNPFIAISSGTTRVFKTGHQRLERPRFSNKIAPCRQACPIGIDIPGALHRACKGDLDGALAVYLQENPLPGVCGRVCYQPCENECHRGRFDESINIKSLERYLADHGKHDPKQGVVLASRKEKVAVVGSGPAGLAASFHLAKRGYRVSLFEAKPELGGMLRYGIPDYRLPRHVLDRDIERILSLGIEKRTGLAIGRDMDWRELEPYDAIFLAVGSHESKRLFDGEGSDGQVISGLDFLENPGGWSLHDATQNTLVIGGGNVAIDAARTLLRLRKGCATHITVICPESRDQMPAFAEEIKDAEAEGVSVIGGWAPLDIRRAEGRLVSVGFHRARLLPDKDTGDLKIRRIGNKIKEWPAERVIVAVGQGLDMSGLPRSLKTHEGVVVSDLQQKTSLPGVFAGGDAIGEKGFVADAIASGKRGALAIACFLEGKDFVTEWKAGRIGRSGAFSFECLKRESGGMAVDLSRVVSFEQLNPLFFSKHPRMESAKRRVASRNNSFREVAKGLDQDQMEQEMSRCFHCGTCIDCGNCLDFCPDLSIIKAVKGGVYDFDPDYCKGCGICSVACPRNIIEMTVENP